MKNLNLDEHVGVCVQNPNGFILERNSIAVSTCGQFCNLNCIQQSRKQNGNRENLNPSGFQVLSKVNTCENKLADFVISRLGDKIMTIVYPLDAKIEESLKKYESYSLTPSQKKVIAYLLKGYSNQDIANTLFVSKSTLKKHLNNIYKKIPDHLRPR